MELSAIGLSSSALGYTCGSTGKGTPRQNPFPLTVDNFIELTHNHGLGGVELPLQRFMPQLALKELLELKKVLEHKNLFMIVDSERPLDQQQIKVLLPIARYFSSPVIRIKTSNILGCDRGHLQHPWQSHIQRIISVLQTLKPLLLQYGVKIAIENHQDLDSTDLLQIIDQVGEEATGITFDIGNAFATFEDTMLFAERFGCNILNIHLKDYRIYTIHSGFKLVRCPLGKGAVDFPPMLSYFHNVCPHAHLVIELGALNAREVRYKDNGFWDSIEARNPSEIETFLQVLSEHAIEDYDQSWMTPFEQGAPFQDIIDYELTQLQESLAYLKEI